MVLLRPFRHRWTLHRPGRMARDAALFPLAIRPLRALLLRDYGERLSPMQDTQTAGENRQTTSEVNGKARAGVRITLQVAQAKAINFNM
ncbi:hypothetical protein VDF54_17850 [Xanthomonas campestris pv. raphani]|uniref:hypothetical protein n=1 Tax=Xanthomonas campestris TaxID=339 RepID=UPI002B238714|nr:hypothetical protein [Xanthomonas campestris]MEA9776922.1 hypothetical protein [Xanthomonas campestris pv. raphani]